MFKTKIIGNTTATPMAIPDWKQVDARKADYIKNKPTKLSEFENDLHLGELVIEESDDIICNTEGAVLETRMTPAEAIEAVKRGLTLKVLSSNATGEFMIFHLVTMYDYTDENGCVNLVFQRKGPSLDGEVETRLTISVAEGGTMTTVSIVVEAIGANTVIAIDPNNDGNIILHAYNASELLSAEGVAF